MVQLIRLEAFGKVKSGEKLEQQLQAMTNSVVTPEMPKTAAVLQSIAASDDHPGAIYRLAGDRCVPVLLDLATKFQALRCTYVESAKHQFLNPVTAATEDHLGAMR